MTTANVVAGEYTITVDDLTATVKGETSKVDKIEILSEQAAAYKSNPNGSKYDKAQVGYRVLNQFGDDITKTTTLTVTSSVKTVTLKAKDHIIEFTSNDATNGFMINRDIITVMLLDNQTGVCENKNLTVSMEASAKEITFEGIYQAEDVALTEDTDTEDVVFYALFTALDQYGNKLKSYKNVKEGKDLFLTVMGGMTTLSKYNPSNPTDYSVITKNGTEYLAYRIAFDTSSAMAPIAGEVQLQILSSSGASQTGTITVAEGNRVVSISVSNPVALPAGEKTEIPFTATDAAGKDVTSFKILNRVTIHDNAYAPLKFEKQLDGTAKLMLDARAQTLTKNNQSMQTYTFETQSKKYSHATLTITETARPVAIDGVSSSTEISASANYLEIKAKDLKIEDQYGRVMDEDALDRVLKSSASGAYKLNIYAIYKTDATNQVINVQTVTLGNAITKADTVIAKVYAVDKGIGSVTFKIKNALANDHADYMEDEVNVLYTVKDTANVEEAAVTVSPIYVVKSKAATNADGKKYTEVYEQEVVVKAKNVKLPAKDFSVSVPDGFYAYKAADDALGYVWKLQYTGEQNDITEFKNNTADTVTKSIKITLNGSGETITQDVTLSKVAPYADSISLKKGKDTFSVYVADTLNASTTLDNDDVFAYCINEIKDQYGKKAVEKAGTGWKFANGDPFTAKVTFSDLVDNALTNVSTISKNGTDNAQLTASYLFKAATMRVAYGDNVAPKKFAEIKLVRTTSATATNTVEAELAKLIEADAARSSYVALVDSSKQQLGSAAWEKLTVGVDKEKVIKAIDGAGMLNGTKTLEQVQTAISGAAVTAAAVRVAIKSGSSFVTSGGALYGDNLAVSASAILTAANSKISSATITSKSSISGVCTIVDGTSGGVTFDKTKFAANEGKEIAKFTVEYVMQDSGDLAGCGTYFNETVTYVAKVSGGKLVIIATETKLD